MKIVTLFYVFLISFASLFGGKSIKQAEKAYKRSNYIEAIKSYEEHLAEKGDVDAGIRSKMASCYYFLNKYDSAMAQFKVIGEENLSVNDLAIYGDLAFKNGDFTKAKSIFSMPSIMSQSKSKQVLESIRWMEEKKEESSMKDVKKSPVKTYGQSFGTQYYKGGIVYSSSNSGNEILDYHKAKNVDQKGFEFLNLYYSPVAEEGDLGQPVLFSETLVFDYHVGAVSFSKDFKKMYFTKVLKINEKKDVLQIFYAEYIAGTWGRQRSLNFNSETFSCAHPAVSISGDTLYYVSDKPGGIGGKDIYYSYKIGNGWSAPINMGSPVNSEGDELFPFVDKYNMLYFASDGHPGYGGLDVFRASLNVENSDIENMGFGINSAYDDFAYTIDPKDENSALLSSNRDSKGSSDNIYFVSESINIVRDDVEEVKEDSLIKIYDYVSAVRNGLSGAPITNANVRIEFVDSERVLLDAKTDEKGYFQTSIDTTGIDNEEPLHIMVVVENEGFEPFSKMISAGEFFANKGAYEEINLVPVLQHEQKVTIPQDRLQFALNSDVLSYEAKRLMERWFEYLNKHSETRIRLNAHTDSQGNLDYNLQLSQRRADNAKAYLMQKGVSEDRIIARGYGERYILNQCTDGVSCTDDEHEVNRRIEIIVVQGALE